MVGAGHPLRMWREAQSPKLTLDAAGAAVGTVRQVWFDWENGRNIPSRTYMLRIYGFTQGEVEPNDFYDLPAEGQYSLPIAMEPAPLFDHAGPARVDGELKAIA
jgi:hypothetical protein